MIAISTSGSLKASENTIKCDGQTDDTKAIQYVVNNYKNVLIPEGKCIVTKSITLSNKVNIYSLSANNTQIIQTGSPPEANSLFTLTANASGSTIKNITLQGMSLTKEMTEHQHLIKLLGVSNISLERIIFKEFRGDGIYIGKKDNAINENISITQNTFDGVNHNNRNAISIISGKSIKIIDNKFINTTKENMPGAIDLEPNDHKDKIEDIIITKNNFYNIGGYSAISIYFSKKASVTPSNYTITQNNIEVQGNTKSIAFRDIRKLKTPQEWDKLSIYDNNLSSQNNDSIHISGIKYSKLNVNLQSGNDKR